ncbi:MAG: enoyl-CoA hydratase-related protein [Xanthobacteraceae bacterium]|nr:enoyl-CoA hydratase-related protein [Xanthobacteraceae bacterium]
MRGSGDRARQRPCARRRLRAGLCLRFRRGGRGREARHPRGAHRHLPDDDPALDDAHHPAPQAPRALCVTGEPIGAAEALAHGMVNHVVPAEKLDEKVDALVAAIAASSPTAIRMGRRALATLDSLSVDEGLEYAQRVLPQMARTEDAREGFRAFNEKRAPVWTGR